MAFQSAYRKMLGSPFHVYEDLTQSKRVNTLQNLARILVDSRLMLDEWFRGVSCLWGSKKESNYAFCVRDDLRKEGKRYAVLGKCLNNKGLGYRLTEWAC